MNSKRNEQDCKLGNISKAIQLYNAIDLIDSYNKERKVPGISESDSQVLEKICDKITEALNKKHKYDFFIHKD